MLPLLKLQAKSWVSNVGSWMGFLMSVLFLFVLGALTSSSATAYYNAASLSGDPIVIADAANRVSQAYLTILGSILILNSMQAAIQTFGFSFFQMKESVLLKRIGATQITKFGAIGSFILWGFITMWLNVIWTLLWVGIMTLSGHPGSLFFLTNDTLNGINWLGAITSITINAIAFYAISLFFVSISKNSEMYNIFATLYFFFVAFLGGGFMPSAAAGREWMTTISQLSPFGWTSHMMIDSLNGCDVFNLGNGYISQTYGNVGVAGAILNLVMPIVYFALATMGAVKLFKWD